VAETIALEPLGAKWRAFGWRVIRLDGHDHAALRRALAAPAGAREPPLCVIADTVKGKGVSFMENEVIWHYRSPQGEEYAAAMRELGGADA
jgi:transketolase